MKLITLIHLDLATSETSTQVTYANGISRRAHHVRLVWETNLYPVQQDNHFDFVITMIDETSKQQSNGKHEHTTA